MNQEWIEMVDLRRRDIARATWIPLRCEKEVNEGNSWKPEDTREYIGAVSIMFPVGDREAALELGWGYVNVDHHYPIIEGTNYLPCGTLQHGDLRGAYPVIRQYRDADRGIEWHLDQDLIIALGLTREGDTWVCPQEDYIEVVKFETAADGSPRCMTIRSEQLRDYLCARGCGLLVSTYHRRQAAYATDPAFSWKTADVREDTVGVRWEGHITEINELGMRVGSTIKVVTVSRDDPELEEEVPKLDRLPADGSIRMNDRDLVVGGKRLVLASGEMWRAAWVEPASASPRVRHDTVDPTIPFIIDNDGSKAVGPELRSQPRWLWFDPAVIQEVLRRRGGAIGWHTEYTGWIGLPSHSGLHFGVNEAGLINIFAKDVADLPEHVQKLWSSYNVLPEGGVCEELRAAEMESNPARTIAAEVMFARAVERLQVNSARLLGNPLLSDHAAADAILRSIHRFQAIDRRGLFRLCKEITRFVTDRIDMRLLKHLQPKTGTNLRSLKLLAALLDEHGTNGPALTAPLVGTFELRLADAHPPASDVSDSFMLLGFEDEGDDLQLGKRIIEANAAAILGIAKVLEKKGR